MVAVMLAFSEGGPSHVADVVRAGVGLVAIAALVGVATKFVRVPYTVALVVAGLGLALLRTRISGVHITEELVVMLFLPPLLFQAGLHLDLHDLKKQWIAVSLLAIPGVVLTTAAAAAAIRYILPLAVGPEHANWTTAVVLGAVVAPTDPISVVSIFRLLGVPHRLRVLVEGESLFNDGTAAALFGVLKAGIVAAALAGTGAHLPGAGDVAGGFWKVAGIGTVVGLGLGLMAFWVLKNLNDHTLETAITIALAWGAFVVAESVHSSGVIAVVVAGLLIGNYGKALAMSDETRITLTGFWDSIDFVVNSVVFLLVGLELSAPEIGGLRHLTDGPVLLGAAAVYGALLAARGVKVWLVAIAERDRWPRRWIGCRLDGEIERWRSSSEMSAVR